VSGGHRHGIVQTYTKIKGKEKDWKIQRFCLKPQEKYGGGDEIQNSSKYYIIAGKEK
jgi:hypothetical protein